MPRSRLGIFNAFGPLPDPFVKLLHGLRAFMIIPGAGSNTINVIILPSPPVASGATTLLNSSVVTGATEHPLDAS